MLLATGIPVIPWKGPMLAELLYGDKTLRPCADIDLLVPPALAWRALQTLVRAGYSPGFVITSYSIHYTKLYEMVWNGEAFSPSLKFTDPIIPENWAKI